MFMVITIKDNVPQEIHHVGFNRDIAVASFLDVCNTSISNWSEYRSDDINEILDMGYIVKMNGDIINLIDTDGWSSDQNILQSSNVSSPDLKSQKIIEWLSSGEIGPVSTVQEVLDNAGRRLDKAESYEILGEVIFKAEDGHVYVVTVEAEVGEINPDYLEEFLQQVSD